IAASFDNLGAVTMSTTIKTVNIKLKRAYDPPEPADGIRILVDRLWPRGVKKVDAAIDQWMKDIAPSADLRNWFGHDPVRWEEFCERYAAELGQHPEQLEQLRELARKGPITLVYSARDEAHNDAVALRAFILGRKKETR
ncbi:MAG TPA: DUF488 domain-containing protein, partial [Nitrosospira sp.]